MLNLEIANLKREQARLFRALAESLDAEAAAIEKAALEVETEADRLLTVKEYAGLVRRSRVTVLRWIRAGLLPFEQLGGASSPYLIRANARPIHGRAKP